MVELVCKSGRMWAMALAVVALLSGSHAATAAFVTRNVNVTLNAANIESYNLDVDLNGTTDFKFTAAYVPDPDLSVGFDVVDFPFASRNGVVIDQTTGDGFPTASRLSPGNTVSSANLFSFGSNDQGNLFFYISTDTPPATGNFDGRTGYIGLKFERGTDILYGFAQITVNSLTSPTNPLGLTIGTIGYQTVAGQPVTIPANAVPEPGAAMAMFFGLCTLAPVARRIRRGV